MDKYFQIFIVLSLSLLLGLPVWIGVAFGKSVICNKDNTIDCIRSWLSALAGPLAIVAAVLAAWPVYDQLEESRVVTKLSMASVINIEEIDLTGAMSALREEAVWVDGSRTMLNEINDLVEKAAVGSATLTGKTPLASIAEKSRDYVSDCERISGTLDSKGDKDTVLPKRKDIAAGFFKLKVALRSLYDKRALPSSDKSVEAAWQTVKDIDEKIGEAITDYDQQYRAFNEEMAHRRDALTTIREDLQTRVLSKIQALKSDN